jgi:phosphoribosylformylglycinamidine (FGAM) synthase-like amidotransferase family enzyme
LPFPLGSLKETKKRRGKATTEGETMEWMEASKKMLMELKEKKEELDEYQVGFCRKIAGIIKKKQNISKSQLNFLIATHAEVFGEDDWKQGKADYWKKVWKEEKRD